MQDLVFKLKEDKVGKKLSIKDCPEPPSYPRNRQDIFRLMIGTELYKKADYFMCVALAWAERLNIISERECELCIRSIESYMNYLIQNYEKVHNKSFPLRRDTGFIALRRVLRNCNYDNSTEQLLLLYYNWSNKPYPKVTQKPRKKGTKLISLKSKRYEYL